MIVHLKPENLGTINDSLGALMIQYTVIVEDKDGNEVTGHYESPAVLVENDQFITVKNYKGLYTGGFLLEILNDEEKRNVTL